MMVNMVRKIMVMLMVEMKNHDYRIEDGDDDNDDGGGDDDDDDGGDDDDDDDYEGDN